MSGQQGGTPGQPSGAPRQDQESTQIGMPVPPQGPGYVQQPPYGQPYGQTPPYGGGQPPAQPQAYPPVGYGQQPGYPGQQAGYPPQQPGYPPQQPGYGATPPGYVPPGYGYGAPPPKRGGPSGLILGAFALLIVLAIGVGVLYFGKLGPFATAVGSPQPTRTPVASPTRQPTPAATATANPTASATPTPTATSTPTALPSEVATATPTGEPPTAAPTDTPTGSSADAQAALLSHVPQTFSDTCVPTDVTSDGGTAAVDCTATSSSGNDISVTYMLFGDATSMQNAYDLDKSVFAPSTGSKNCSVGSNWPSDYSYTISNQPAGRVMCLDLFGLLEMYWTDTRYNILSLAIDVTGTKTDLYTFWKNDSGPV